MSEEHKLNLSKALKGARHKSTEARMLAGDKVWVGFARKWMMKKFGTSCQSCGWSGSNPTTNKPIIELDHIDGNRDNQKPENLRLLCPNCHAMTPTYKTLNRKKF